jgi:ribonuclease Z
MIDVTLVGTGGTKPLKDRNLTSCFIEMTNGKAILIDCGEGTQVALATQNLNIHKIEVILLTHFHGDHIAGLTGLFLEMTQRMRKEPVHIYGPIGLKSIIGSILKICGLISFRIECHELNTKECNSFKLTEVIQDLTVKFELMNHTVPCLGYSLILDRKPVFNPSKAEALGVPKYLWKKLHAYEDVVVDGKIITTKEVIDGVREPLKITYVTDTLPIKRIETLAENSDIFICEGMYGVLAKKQSMNKKKHMLMQDACKLAKTAKVKELWLTHYSPAMEKPEKYAEGLKRMFSNTVVSQDGQYKRL